MITKGSLVYFTLEPSCLFIVISDPYEWIGGPVEAQVVDIYDDFGVRTANVEHLTVLSQ